MLALKFVGAKHSVAALFMPMPWLKQCGWAFGFPLQAKETLV